LRFFGFMSRLFWFTCISNIDLDSRVLCQDLPGACNAAPSPLASDSGMNTERRLTKAGVLLAVAA
jgi:hypothetical protein